MFAGWIASLQPELRRLGMRLGANPTDAADLVQATSLRALEKRRLFARGSRDDLRRWLNRIMVNLSRDLRRQRTREVFLGEADTIAAVEHEPPPLWTQIADEEVRRAVGRLSLALRDVYLLRAVERCSYARISARLRIPMSTVATRMYRARLRLRALLDPALAAPPAITAIRPNGRQPARDRAVASRGPDSAGAPPADASGFFSSSRPPARRAAAPSP
jgi:RNA polymerase sigma-70 factor (ECF subfamily)